MAQIFKKVDPPNKICVTSTNCDFEKKIEKWKNYTPESLKKLLDKALLNKKNSIKKVIKRKPRTQSKFWINRRRPVAGVLHGLQYSHFAYKYTELLKYIWNFLKMSKFQN